MLHCVLGVAFGLETLSLIVSPAFQFFFFLGFQFVTCLCASLAFCLYFCQLLSDSLKLAIEVFLSVPLLLVCIYQALAKNHNNVLGYRGVES